MIGLFIVSLMLQLLSKLQLLAKKTPSSQSEAKQTMTSTT